MKPTLKRIAEVFAVCLVLPAWVMFRLQSCVVNPRQVFPGWSQVFSLLPGFTGAYLRAAFYRLVLPSVGANAWISFGTIFSRPTAEIGETVYVGAYCVLGNVRLEDDVLIGSQVSILSGAQQHGIGRLDIPVREQPGQLQQVTIGEDTWIGDRAVVMANVGCHCVIGAGAVVTKPIPDFAIAVGNPAKVVRFRDAMETTRRSPDELCADNSNAAAVEAALQG